MNIFRYGIDNVWKEDEKSQLSFLNSLAETRYMDVNFFKEQGIIFIPNQDYLVDYFGPQILNPDLGFYGYDSSCKWVGRMLIPIKDYSGDDIVGFTGYNPFTKLEGYDGSGEKYIVSDRRVFDKDKYLLCPRGYRNMIEENYTILVDGVFDSLTLASLGLNSVAGLGSYVSKEIIYILSFVENLYIAYDNDGAGLEFYKKIKRIFPKAIAIKQGKNKDIDGYLNSGDKNRFVQIIQNSLKSAVKYDLTVE